MLNVKQLSHSEHAPSGHKFPIVVLLDKLTNPSNIGSIFRISDAFSVSEILIMGEIFPPNKKITKSARSCDKLIPYRVFKNSNEALLYLKKNHYTIIALEITNNSEDLTSMDFSQFPSFCLVVGSEKNGISQEFLNIAEKICHIKMAGANSSMNAAMALGITLYEATKQLQRNPLT